MANGAHGFAAREEVADELDRFRFDPKQIRIDLSTRQNQAIIFLDPGFGERTVDRDLVAPVLHLPAANFALLRRDYIDLGTRFLQRALRLQKFTLLKAIRRQDGDTLSLQLSHFPSPFGFFDNPPLPPGFRLETSKRVRPMMALAEGRRGMEYRAA